MHRSTEPLGVAVPELDGLALVPITLENMACSVC
jgi:hypothetical protein